MTDYEAIPHALAQAKHWLCYRLTDTGKGRLGKPPVSPKTGILCAKNDETQFTTLEEALVGMERYDLDGVGFVFVGGFVAIDLDDCFDPDKGVLLPVAQDIFDHFSETYWEYSPSGNGLHGFMYGVKPNDRTKDAVIGVEVYSGHNFVTVTGDRVEGTGIDAIPMQDALDWLYAEYLPPIVAPNAERPPVEHGDKTSEEWLALGLAKDEKLARLFKETDHSSDESSADFALLSKLAYWLNRDTEAMIEAFLSSPWARTKDKAHTEKLKRADYLPVSVEKAAALCSVTAYETSKSYETKAVRFFARTPQADGTDDIPLDEYTDLGNAQAMAAVFGDVLCYTPEWGWCFFDGARWETDVSYRAMEAARDIAQGLMVSAKEWLAEVQAEEAEETGDDGKAIGS